ncbi:MAG: molybdopterin oxidoreductase [Capsulimonas sp.]|uniref:molybdopterin oxidoreductase n=1 Tax=Capsulimonas sp. TaxID=2494211 RepID=UPI00326448C3
MSFTSTQSEPPVVISETRTQLLLRTQRATPRFLQGVYPFAGRGVFDLGPLNEALSYTVPKGKIAQLHYFRAGNLSDDILYLAISVNGTPVRYFPVGPKSDNHVPLAIVEDHPAGALIEVRLAAPRGLTGTVVLDVGLIEIDAEEQS